MYVLYYRRTIIRKKIDDWKEIDRNFRSPKSGFSLKLLYSRSFDFRISTLIRGLIADYKVNNGHDGLFPRN